jgi:hypothetical protein
LPFLTASAQLGVWQAPPAQTALVQSPPRLHADPMLHGGQTPPQSVSGSVPFFTESVQVGATQIAVVSQTPLEQSVPTMHPAPTAQRKHVVPPQSTPVSLPF